MPPHSPALERALHAFAMREAARERHAALLARAHDTVEESRELRAGRQQLREHTAAALRQMEELRDAVRGYAHALRESHVKPQYALARMKRDVGDVIAAIPSADRLSDAEVLATQMMRWMTDAYYDAA